MTRLAIVRGLTYTNFSQLFSRWLIPTYRTAFRWTGNREDAEDVVTWMFRDIAGNLRLPDLVEVVDDQVVDCTAEAVTSHWNHRYGISTIGRLAIYTPDGTPALESLFDGLNADMRLLLVLRFMRRRSPAAIAAQQRTRTEAARRGIIEALGLIGENIGLPATSAAPVQLQDVSTFVDDLIARRRPLRFDVRPDTLPPMVAAGHLQAAIAGNDLPSQGFVRSLERRLQTGPEGRLVTDARIWSA